MGTEVTSVILDGLVISTANENEAYSSLCESILSDVRKLRNICLDTCQQVSSLNENFDGQRNHLTALKFHGPAVSDFQHYGGQVESILRKRNALRHAST